jgi:hypothetical protein
MKLQLMREQYRPDSTVGRLLVDGTFECFTLEDGIRANKVQGRTAIPPGTYRVTVTPSPRFRKDLPRLHDVPNFQGVLIHPGNTAADTEGCILVGAQWQPGAEAIGRSRVAFAALFAKIQDALARGDGVEIEIVQDGAPADLRMRAVRPSRPPVAARKAAPKRKAVPKRKAAPKRKTAGRTAGAKTGAAKPAGRKAKPARRR